MSFQAQNPWILQERINELQSQGYNNLPTFEELLEFKDILFIDSMSKIYSQIKQNNPLLINTDLPVTITFYGIKKNLYKKQLEKGYRLGDIDDMGILVSGSDLVLETLTLNLQEFLDLYYTTNN
jgi:hypothetical protein